MHTRTLLAALALLLLVPAGRALAGDDDAGKRPAVPDFQLEDLDGDRVRLEDLRGKVVVVSFWATWCVPCKQELILLNKLYEEHRDDGLVVLAIATDGPETFSRIRGFVKRHKWVFPVLPDREGRATSRLNPRGVTPYTLFVDRRGRQAWDHEGYSRGDGAEVRRRISALLEEPAP